MVFVTHAEPAWKRCVERWWPDNERRKLSERGVVYYVRPVESEPL